MPHFNVFRSIMKHWVLRKLYATLIIAMDDHWVKLSPEQIKYQFSEPNCFLAGVTCSNILCLSCTLSYGILLPAGPRDLFWSHTEAITRGTFSINYYFEPTFEQNCLHISVFQSNTTTYPTISQVTRKGKEIRGRLNKITCFPFLHFNSKFKNKKH